MSPKCRTMSLTSFRVTNILKFWPKLSQHHDDGTNITVPICMKIIPHTNNLTRTIPWLHVFWVTSPPLDLFHRSFLTDFEVETKQKSKKNPFYQGRRYCHDNSWFCEFIKIHTKIKFWNYSLSLDHYIFLFRGEPVSNRTNGQREASTIGSQLSPKAAQLSPKMEPRIKINPILEEQLKWNRGPLEKDSSNGIRMAHLQPPPKFLKIPGPPQVERTVLSECKALADFDLQNIR